MKFLLLDDDNDFLEQIKQKIIIFSIKENLDIKLVSYNHIPETLEQDIDAYFLDIEINKKISFSYAEQIKKKFPQAPIIFLSNFDAYINKSVKYFIFDFIRKSHLNSEFDDTLVRLAHHLHNNSKEIIINSNHLLTKIKIEDIIYIEAYSHNCVIHLLEEDYPLSKGISQILDKHLEYFTRVHKSSFVNMRYAISISHKEIILNNGIRISIGKNYCKLVQEAFVKILLKK